MRRGRPLVLAMFVGIDITWTVGVAERPTAETLYDWFRGEVCEGLFTKIKIKARQKNKNVSNDCGVNKDISSSV